MVTIVYYTLSDRVGDICYRDVDCKWIKAGEGWTEGKATCVRGVCTCPGSGDKADITGLYCASGINHSS